MKQLYYAISGTGMMITGAVLINIFRQVLDLQRIKTYGLVHELSLGGTATTFITVGGMILVFLGIILILIGGVKKN